MGEVYRATDTKLGREVAIKVLPAEARRGPRAPRPLRARGAGPRLAQAPEHRPRSTASRSRRRPRHFLVMELVEGEDLAERLKRGPLPLDEAARVARQIAEALEAAHEKGIVHRDLKPANVKLTPGRQGQGPRLRPRQGAGRGRRARPRSAPELSQSPTLATRRARRGVILGTAAYMAPEQARGKAGRPARRHLGLRRRALRDADRQAVSSTARR